MSDVFFVASIFIMFMDYDGGMYPYIDDFHMLDDVILCFILHVRLISAYDVV